MSKYYQKASGDSGSKSTFNNRSSSKQKLSIDLSNRKISSDKKYDINDKDLDNPIYLEETDVRNIKKNLTSKINNEDDQKFSRINSNSQRKNNYNYYESKYSKSAADNDNSSKFKPDKGRRTVSLDYKLNDNDNNKDYTNINTVSPFSVYSTHNRVNNTNVVKQDYSTKLIPRIPKNHTN